MCVMEEEKENPEPLVAGVAQNLSSRRFSIPMVLVPQSLVTVAKKCPVGEKPLTVISIQQKRERSSERLRDFLRTHSQ